MSKFGGAGRRRSWSSISVAGGDLDFPEWDAGVEGGHDEIGFEHVWMYKPDPSPFADRADPTKAAVRSTLAWLRGSRLGLVNMALVVGGGAGLGVAGFRCLFAGFVWLATGRQQFGQLGRVAGRHLPLLGIWFVLFIPGVEGLIYGPLVQRFAREARGHGGPEVMVVRGQPASGSGVPRARRARSAGVTEPDRTA